MMITIFILYSQYQIVDYCGPTLVKIPLKYQPYLVTYHVVFNMVNS